MTKDQMEENKELLDKAKDLGIKGAHLCSVETLEQKVKEEEAFAAEVAKKKTERKVAPVKLKVTGIKGNEREDLLAELEAENPDYKYMFQSAGVTQRILDAKGLEATDITLGNEVVCRTDKESFFEMQRARNEEQRQMMRAIDPDCTTLGGFDAAPKKGR